MTDDQHTPTGDENRDLPGMWPLDQQLDRSRRVVREVAWQQLGLELHQDTLTAMLEAVYRAGYEDGVESTVPTVVRLAQWAQELETDVPRSEPEK